MSYTNIANIAYYRQIGCSDTYVWYCVPRIPTYNTIQNRGAYEVATALIRAYSAPYIQKPIRDPIRISVAPCPGSFGNVYGSTVPSEPNFWHTQRDVCQKVGPESSVASLARGELLCRRTPLFGTRLFVCAKNWVLRHSRSLNTHEEPWAGCISSRHNG